MCVCVCYENTINRLFVGLNAEWKSEHKWCSIREALKDAEPVISQDVLKRLARPEPEEVTPEQMRYRLAMRAKDADDKYRRMIQNVAQQSAFNRVVGRRHIPQTVAEIMKEEEEADVRNEMKVMTGNSYLAINLIVAMIACFAVGYYLGSVWWKESWDQAPWVCGIVGLVGALFIEATLLIIGLARQDAAESKKINSARKLRGQRKPVRPIVYEVPVPAEDVELDSMRSKKDD